MKTAKARRVLLRGSALAGVLYFGVLSASAWAQSTSYSFDIPAEPLATALHDFARISGEQIIFTDSLVAGKSVAPLHGKFTPDEALARLLAGTGLVVDRSSPNGIMIQPKKEQAASNEEAAPGANDVETVVVTGSHLKGVSPASPVTVVTRDDIDKSGYSNIGDVVRSLPQDSGAGTNPTSTGMTGINANTNISYASSFNLRGLGSESTLTLVDGHRIASDGYIGGVVDVSAIPLAAVDRIEILTDGASAIYGADAVSGVANIIMRKDYDGAQTSGRIGTSSDGGATEYDANQLLGTDWGSGGGLINYEHYHQNSLYASQRDFASSTPSPFSLLPSQTRDAVFGSVHQDLSNSVSLFAEGLFSHRSAQFVETIPSVFSLDIPGSAEVYGITAGVNWQISPDWTASVTNTFSRSSDHQIESIASPPIPLISQTYRNGIENVEGLVTGSLFELPGGSVSLAVGGGYREEIYRDNIGGAADSARRDVEYGFGEIHLPFVTESNGSAGLERLEVSLAGRVENYSDFGSTADPKIGLVYAPTSDLNLRSTWSTSFRVPGLDIEYGARQLYADTTDDGYIGATPGTQVLYTYGANPSLRPEKSSTWTVGADYTPKWAENLRISATGYEISYRDRIIQPVDNFQAALVTPADAPFVVQNPSLAQISQVQANANQFVDFTGGAYNPALVSLLIYGQYQNVAQEKADGVDLQVDYHLPSEIGDFDFTGAGSWIKLTELASPTSQRVTLSGTVFYPTSFKGRFGLSWQKDEWSSALFVNYVAGEKNAGNIPPQKVPSWTTADAQVAYSLKAEGLASGLRFSVAVRNLFDQNPPRVASSAYVGTFDAPGYDPANANPLGRFVSLTVSKDW